ncbi:alpha/beta hydrolase family protein [Bradyrhizobium liaoningense]|uniref:hypothetical protein n=1 Tax=Bradyrhizobium liaoningense TaxID=43992 RepID=UPI0012FD7480|nr:hypothetical protein [Bradyrhizobium liaoningense]
MACAAYADCTATKYVAAGYKEDLRWQDVLRQAAPGRDINSVISIFEKAGFSATLYRNDQTREIVVAIRGSEGDPGKEFGKYLLAKVDQRLGRGTNDLNGDWQTDFRARFDLKSANDKLEAQYVAARLLARAVDKTYSNVPYGSYTRVLSGHSLGGGLSLYAGKYVSAHVYAFEPSGNVLSAGDRNSRQHIIIADNDPISDPRMGAVSKVTGSSKLSGPIYTVGLVSDKVIGNPKDTLPAQHDKNAIVARLASIADGTANRWDYHLKQAPLGEIAGTTPQRLPIQPTPQTSQGIQTIQSAALPRTQSRSQVALSANPSAPSRAVVPSPFLTQQSGQLPMPGGSPSSSRVTGFASPTTVVPGGISLSRAAADRIPLEIALDASALSEGKIILSGRASKTRMDAALFLTALRAACDDRDPYFSLDPDNGALWSQQGNQASIEFWEKTKKDFSSSAVPSRAKNAQSGINIRTVSATQDYPGIWNNISPQYPNFRSKLVFYPEWLRQTRLGEVFYKADVLLKELSSGVSILVPGKLRASAIPGYLSADVEYAAKGLLDRTRDQTAVRPQWRGSRLWFEITPSNSPTTIMNEAAAPPSLGDTALRSLLQSKGLIRSTDQAVRNASFFVRHGSVFDLSQVNPIMFVRVHDHATNKDLSDHDPRLDGLAADVSARFAQYAQHYDELGLLREVFRAYIAARKITEANDRLCGTLDAMPLLDSEKLTAPLPNYHPSELFVTIASYTTVSRKGSQTQFVKASSMSGGVSIAGQKFAETAVRDGETTVTRAVEAALAGADLNKLDAIDSGRKFIAFVVEDGSGALVRLASYARDPLAPRSLSDYPIENEPVARANPFARPSGQGGGGVPIGVFLGLVTLGTLGLLVNYVARKLRMARR